jgi:hypothetical protein
MLFIRFLTGAGGVLLLLLLATNAYLPQRDAPVAEEHPIDHSIIRITSTQKGPARVVYDTSLPTIVPPVPAVAEAAPPAPPRATAASARETATREAMAQLPPDSPELTRTSSKEVRHDSPRPRRHLTRRAPMVPAQPRQVADIFGFTPFTPWR